MNNKKTNSILKEVLEIVKPSNEDVKKIRLSLNEFLEKIKKNMKKNKIKAEIFIGGSFAKGTMIKSKEYDIDVFIRFEKTHKKNISDLTEKILDNMKKTRIHGSRDYFKIKIGQDFFIEIVPVRRINNPKEAENVTDLSYSHVNYIKRKVKSDKILDDIRLAKVFCHANNSYGAESYIRGFSGYSLELLVYHYNGFLNFVKAMSKTNPNEKTTIDIEKHFKNKQEILMNVNSSKLQSPIILIDPTYKQRNALAALSKETFENFQRECIRFLKKPTMEFFAGKKTNFNKIKPTENRELLKMEIKTDKQNGDIAGSKLFKFYRHLEDEISKFFIVRKMGFEYGDGKSARIFFVTESKKSILLQGPKLSDQKNTEFFRKKHKKTFAKKGRVYSEQKINFGIKEFLKNWESKNRKKMREMSIVEMKII